MKMELNEMKTSLTGREERFVNLSEIRIAKDEGEPVKIIGHAAVFNTIADLGWFREQILPGAFTDAIKTSDVKMLFNHDANYIMGRNTSGTLKLSEDKKGLAIEALPPDTQLIRDMVLTPMERGDLSQMSFAFMVEEEQWTEKKDEIPLRSIVRVNPLYDVSVVTYPAYPKTDAKLRDMFREAGLEYEKLSDTLFRLKRGLSVNQTDYDLIKTSIEVLKGYIPAPPDGTNGGKGGENEAGRLLILRKRLELIEKTF